MKRVFEARDGKQFPTEQECVEHENHLDAVKYGEEVLLFDQHGCRLPLTVAGWNGTTFLYLKTDEAAQFVSRMFNNISWAKNSPWSFPEEARASFWFFDYLGSQGWRKAQMLLDAAEVAKQILAEDSEASAEDIKEDGDDAK